jgi:flagellar biosynthetic protein FliR
MPVELFNTGSLFRLASVALRLSALLVFLPLPGFKNLPTAARVLFALSLGAVLAASTPPALYEAPTGSDFVIRLLADLLTGVSIGLVSTLVVEAFTFGGQVISVQAGFSYASTIDPFSESDSGILPSIFSLAANLLLFESPLYAELIRALMGGLLRTPEQVSLRAPEMVRILIGFSAHCLQIGIKLALPIIALLFLADLCIGLFGRLQPQIQFLSMSFSLKLLGAMAAVAALVPALDWLYQQLAVSAVNVLHFLAR